MIKYTMYWMYDNRIENPNPLEDGYIGVTTGSVKRRVSNHVNGQGDYYSGNKRRVHMFISELPEGALGVKELCWSYDEDRMSMLERLYRPRSNMGWNAHPGGKKIGESKPFTIVSPEGIEYKFKTQYDARAAGFKQGHISECLNGKGGRKTFQQGHTVSYD